MKEYIADYNALLTEKEAPYPAPHQIGADKNAECIRLLKRAIDALKGIQYVTDCTIYEEYIEDLTEDIRQHDAAIQRHKLNLR